MADLDSSITRTNENIIRYVYRLILLEATIFGLLFFSIQYPYIKTEKLQFTSNQYHLASLHYSSAIMEKVTAFGMLLRGNDELKASSNENIVSTNNYKDNFNAQVAPRISKPIKTLRIIQDQFQGAQFSSLLNVIEQEYAKLNHVINETDKQNITEIERALVSFLNPIHQFNQLHELAFSNDKIIIEQIKTNHLGYLGLVMVILIIVGVYSVNQLRKSIGSILSEKGDIENALAENEANLRSLTENASDGMLVCCQGKYVFANKALEEILDYNHGELIGKTLEELIYPTEHNKITNVKNQLNSAEKTKVQVEISFVSQYGEPVPVEAIITMTVWNQQSAIMAVVRDLRKVHEAQQQIQKQATIIDQIHESVIATDLEGNVTGWNKGAERLFGFRAEEILGRHISGLYPVDEHEFLQAQVIAPLRDKGFHDAEVRMMRRNGKDFYAHLSLSMLYDVHGNVVGMIGYSMDITESKKAKRDLEEYRDKLEELVNERTLELQQSLFDLKKENQIRMTTESLLVEAKNEAERANQQKSEFLSRMSHELRTPMNAILGFGQLLYRENIPAEPKSYVDEILTAGEHLQQLIDEVLDLSKIESGSISLEMGDISLRELVYECVSLIQGKLVEQKILLHVNLDFDNNVCVYVDRTRVKEVLVNLLTNAIKYNHKQGFIEIYAEFIPENKVRVFVVDTGMGIPAISQSEIFEPFTRLGAESTAVEGTGIGLTIAKRLMTLMGGSIGVESVPGEGSVFWLDCIVSGKPETLIKPKQSEAKQAMKKSQFTVLYIEANKANAKLIEHVIKRYSNYALLTADNAEDGIEMARKLKPDVIVLDINLPGMDGYEALEVLRKDETTLNIPVLALSASARSIDIERGNVAGFNHYLTKPVDVIEFMSVLNGELNTREEICMNG